MTLHFSHIGLTEGLTFTLASLSWAGFNGPRRELWRPLKPPLPEPDVRAAQRGVPRRRQVMLAGVARWPAGKSNYAAARPPDASCQGVRILGPSAVTATV